MKKINRKTTLDAAECEERDFAAGPDRSASLAGGRGVSNVVRFGKSAGSRLWWFDLMSNLWDAVDFFDFWGPTANRMETDGNRTSPAFCEWHAEELQTGAEFNLSWSLEAQNVVLRVLCLMIYDILSSFVSDSDFTMSLWCDEDDEVWKPKCQFRMCAKDISEMRSRIDGPGAWQMCHRMKLAATFLSHVVFSCHR